MLVSFVLCLLPALLATSAQGETMTCDLCVGLTETCNVGLGTCQDDKATGGCISTAEDVALNGTRTLFFSKQCLSNYTTEIKVSFSFTLGNGNYLRINTTRCNDTDKCNSDTLAAPQVNTTANGLQCPTCFALSFTTCNSQITPCTGDETYCMDFTGFLKQGTSSSPFQAKGCATESAQAIKPGSFLTTSASKFEFYWGGFVPAEQIPTSPPLITPAPKTTPTPDITTTPSASIPTPTPDITTTPSATIPTPDITTTPSATIPTPTPDITTTPSATIPTPDKTTTPSATVPTPTPDITITPSATIPTPDKTTTPSATVPTPTPDITTTPSATVPNPTPDITTSTTPPPNIINTSNRRTTTTPSETISRGASPALGTFSFTLYLTGLLLVKLLS